MTWMARLLTTRVHGVPSRGTVHGDSQRRRDGLDDPRSTHRFERPMPEHIQRAMAWSFVVRSGRRVVALVSGSSFVARTLARQAIAGHTI